MLRLGGLCAIRHTIHFRQFSTSQSTLADFSHAVIGAGVVGLAIAAELSKTAGNKVVLIEKNLKVGEEVSSRNSEVIHAGLYYPKDSLKTKLCIEGKELIYSEALKAGVEMQKCGKWIVAQNDVEDAYIEHLYWKSKAIGVPTEMIPVSKGQYIEPAIHAERGILSSPTSGIISAHSLMDYLYTVFQEHDGELAVGSLVTDISKINDGYEILAKSTQADEEVKISVNNVINAAGLYSAEVSNMLLPNERHVKNYYAKGTYFSFTNSFPQVRRLIYPVPKKNMKSLGTHLTLSLDGQIKFGPDLEWVDSPTDYKPSVGNTQDALRAIQKYFPHITEHDLEPSYSGIRPKITGPDDDAFQDFIIREEDGFPGFVNLLGIESPGLTSSMAIGKYVSKIYHG